MVSMIMKMFAMMMMMCVRACVWVGVYLCLVCFVFVFFVLVFFVSFFFLFSFFFASFLSWKLVRDVFPAIVMVITVNYYHLGSLAVLIGKWIDWLIDQLIG